jgi:hypothetical protein
MYNRHHFFKYSITDNPLKKIKALSRPAQAPGEAAKLPRNLDPALHP